MCKNKHRVMKSRKYHKVKRDMGRVDSNTRETEHSQSLDTPRRATILLLNEHPNVYFHWTSGQCWDVYGPWVRTLQAVNAVPSVRGQRPTALPAFEVARNLHFPSFSSGVWSLSVSLLHNN